MEEKAVAVEEKPKARQVRTFPDFVAFIKEEIKPKGKVFTLFNVVTLPIIILGLVMLAYRLVVGLGVANSSNEFPWGIWIGFVVMVGVAFAGGAYVVAFIAYILRSEKYHTIVRLAILNGFLAYLFYASAIFMDLSRWWNIYNPIIGNKFGVNSVLFLIAWKFLLYMVTQLVEISPAFAEWIGWKKVKKILDGLTLGAVVFGITLSVVHQSGLGALFLMATWKIHPLWYSEYIPLLFLVSSIFAGLAVVIFIGSLSQRVFKGDQVDDGFRKSWKDISASMAKGCAVTMFTYLFLKLLVFINNGHWAYLNSPMGYWYLLEIVGLTLIPCIMFIEGGRHKSMGIINTAAVLTMLGIIINRVNYSLIAYKWYIPMSERYIPSANEVVTTLTIVLAVVWLFRWIVNRMPILRQPPEWAQDHH